MNTPLQRQHISTLVEAAARAGARVRAACALLGLSVRTLERWRAPAPTATATTGPQTPTPILVSADQRAAHLRAPFTPTNKLSRAEIEQVMAVVNSAPYCHLPPSQIVPRLADTGRYVASESTIYRLLRSHHQLHHRRVERPPVRRNKPRALVAHAIGQVFCWDITYLPTTVAGTFFYLYLFIDLFSRKIVGWQVFERESAALAAALVADICAAEGILPGRLTLHSDNGSPMKGETMLHTLQRLGIAPSRSRPSVSNDNPFVESCFGTLKYRPECPIKPFDNVQEARLWADTLARWYNHEHRHSTIAFVTPNQRHDGLDHDLLNARRAVYQEARDRNPVRWAKNTRPWRYIDSVNLNPDSKPKEPQKSSLKTTH